MTINGSLARKLCGTSAVNGAPYDGRAPLMETNLVETLAIRKFLVTSLEDVKRQVEGQAKAPNVTIKQFQDIKAGGALITSWLLGVLQTVDGMLAQAREEES